MNFVGKMKVCALHDICDLRLDTVDIPSIGDNQVLVKVRAAGICGSDVERVFTKGTYHYPTVIGHEFSGDVVDACGVDSDWLGKRVAVFPMIPCMQCEMCKEGNYAQCKNYDYYGSRRDGGFSEYIAINKWNLVPLSDSVSYECGAMLEPAAVAMHALRQADGLVGRNLAIFGIGAVAFIMAQIARCCGCNKIILVTRSDAKTLFSKQLGFPDVINSANEDVQQKIMNLTCGKGVDIAVEGTGKSETLNAALCSAAPFGTVICMGNPVDDIVLDRNAYWGILRKQLQLRGTWNSSFKVSKDDWQMVLRMIENGQIKLQELITGRYRLEDVNKAFQDINEKKHPLHIKSMFVMEERI